MSIVLDILLYILGKKISPEAQEPFIKLVDEILEKKKLGEDTEKLEDEIDRMVHELYELTPQRLILLREIRRKD